MNGILDLFDLNGDGEPDVVETAMAYTVMFGDEKKEADPRGFDECDNGWEE